MKKHILATLALGTVFAGAVGMVGASPAYASTTYYPTQIQLNGSNITDPQHIVANDGYGETSYLPIYYFQVLLGKLGIQTTWSGTVLNLQLPSGMNADMSNLPAYQSVGASNIAIEINGTVVEYSNRIVANDPASNAPTSYAEEFYVMAALNRLGTSSTWNGTTWNMTASPSTVPTLAPEQQTTMANQMWSLFNATTFDTQSHPTMTQAGVTPQASSPVTAGDVANWIADWARKSKSYTYVGTGVTYPFRLLYTSSSDPFTWTQQNDLWQGTSISNGNDTLTQGDATTVLSNLQWWLNGYKESNGIVTLHEPMGDDWGMWHGATQEYNMPQTSYQQVRAYDAQFMDRVQIWQTANGSTVSMKLPQSVNNSTGSIPVTVVDGRGYVYGASPKNEYGNTTLSIPNTGTGGVYLSLGTIGFDLSYSMNDGVFIHNENGMLNFATGLKDNETSQ